jgi:hypothetical protein
MLPQASLLPAMPQRDDASVEMSVNATFQDGTLLGNAS